MCGAEVTPDGADGHPDVSPADILEKLAQLFEDSPVRFAVLMMRVRHRGITMDELGQKIGRIFKGRPISRQAVGLQCKALADQFPCITYELLPNHQNAMRKDLRG